MTQLQLHRALQDARNVCRSSAGCRPHKHSCRTPAPRAVSERTAEGLTEPLQREDLVGRNGMGTTRIALKPGSTEIIDLNADSVTARHGGNRLTVADLLRDDGAPPRFFSPFVPNRDRSIDAASLPFLLYLPGIDGTGLAASRQFPSLTQDFDLTALSVPGSDRTPFAELTKLVVDYLRAEVAGMPPSRPVYLLGESFGGLLAVAVAAELPDLVDRVVLVNPATSFSRSFWPTLGPLLPSVPPELYRAVPVLLAPVLGNPLALASFGIDPNASFPDKVQGFLTGFQRLLPQLQALADILPAPTLDWKLDLLEAGCRAVEPRLKDVQQRTLLLVSEQDLLLPSREEGPRLKSKLRRSDLRTFPGRTHALLQEAGIDLVEILKEEGFYVQRRTMSAPVKKRTKTTFGDASPLELPTSRELDKTSEGATKVLRRLVSPVHFTTDQQGQVHEGLQHLPVGDGSRPVLFVGNHQTLALDIGFIIEDVLRAKGKLLRGLAHPAVFAGQVTGQAGGNTQFESFMSTYGAVKVGGRSFFRLMQNGEHVLLFPGGVKEAYKNRSEKYALKWPPREEFVRMAARFNALIVPFGAVGCEDSFEFIADSLEQARIPILGPALRRRAAKNIPQARRGVAVRDEPEEFLAPLVLPTLPSRFYFRYGVGHEVRKTDSREHLEAVYQQCQQEVAGHISWLRQRREADPYKDFLPRVAYEVSWGGKQAPTFKL